MRLRDGREVQDRRLDRIPQYDPKSRGYQVRTLLDRTAGVEAARRAPKAWRPAHRNLDQGPNGACVWFSLATSRNASPNRRRPPMTEAEARERYFETQRRDEFAGGEYPGASPVAGGTSLLAGCKLAVELGEIDSYWWVGAGSGTAIDDWVDANSKLGTVQGGVRWLGSMFQTEPGGKLVVDPTSGEYGYHAIASLAFRYAALPGHGTKKVEHFVWPNTWGEGWGGEWFGKGGHCFVTVEDVEAHLLPHQFYGEGVVLVGA